MTLRRPVKVRARRMAMSVASVPDETKRTVSAEGISCLIMSAHSISSS